MSSASSSTTNVLTSSSHSSANSSSVSTGSNQPTNGSSSMPAGSTSKNTSSVVDQAVNTPPGAWVKTFEQNLYHGYHVTPSRYVYIGRGYWEVWVKEINTGQYPYVTVNQYTGNFHG